MKHRTHGQPNRNVNLLVLPIVILGLLGACDVLWGHSFSKRYAEAYLDESILLAAGTYATCRTINAGVSSLQESSLSVSPAGVGIQYHIGQLLDPINDATERLSDICVKSMGLLSAQRIVLFAINQYTIIPFYLATLLAVIVLFLAPFNKTAVSLGKLALLLLLIRLAIPVMCLIGTSTDRCYFSPHLQAQMNSLAQVKRIALAEFDESNVAMAIESSRLVEEKEKNGFWEGLRMGLDRYYDAVRHRAKAIKEALTYFKANFDQIAESLTMLFILFLEKIIVQVFGLPILTFFLVRKIYQLCTGDGLDDTIAALRTGHHRGDMSRAGV